MQVKMENKQYGYSTTSQSVAKRFYYYHAHLASLLVTSTRLLRKF